MSADILADGLVVLLLLGGLACVLLAGIGVLRLPDAYRRMHAATKAGMMGAGLLVLAAAAAIGGPEAWIKAILAVGFLAITSPIASHLLGRAAYVSGAPLWHGTGGDALAGVLTRVADPTLARSDPPPTPEIRMTESLLRSAVPAAPADTATTVPAATGLKSLTVALFAGTDTERATAAALDLARRHAAAVTALTHVDVKGLSNVGPVPVGGLWFAQRLRESRIAQAREATERALAAFEAAATAAGVPYRARHCEERLESVVVDLSMASDLLVLGDKRPGPTDGPTPPRMPDALHAPMLVAPAPLDGIRQCVMTAPCGPAFSRLVASGLLRGATVNLLCRPGEETSERIGDLVTHARLHGIAVEVLSTDGEAGWHNALRLAPDLVVVPMRGALATCVRTPGWRERVCPGWRGPVVFG
ncbi:MAG: monovalent cation/H(+) antiporter subunit G [Rhodospirillales bacterium]